MNISRSVLQRPIIVALAIVFVAIPLSASPVGATENDTDPSRNTTTEATPQIKDETERRVSDMQSTVEKEIEQRRSEKGRAASSDAKRKTVCENRQNAINNKLSAFIQSAEKHQAKLDETFAKVQSYQIQYNLPLANYDELIAAANDKRLAATEAVSALKSVAQDFDCTKPDTVVKLSTVRDAAKEARQSLHEYRIAIKDIVVALAQSEDANSIGASEDDYDRRSSRGL